jgi:hypothetical protein
MEDATGWEDYLRRRAIVGFCSQRNDRIQDGNRIHWNGGLRQLLAAA